MPRMMFSSSEPVRATTPSMFWMPTSPSSSWSVLSPLMMVASGSSSHSSRQRAASFSTMTTRAPMPQSILPR